MTELIFACDAGDIFWQFNGDLRSRYAVGDTVKLVLTVEAEAVSGDMVFENLDYILDNYSMRTNGTYPNIDDYLIIE